MSLIFGCTALLALWVVAVPLFIRQPPWVDNAFFDICARYVLQGQRLYQEVFLHGPPGMVLVYAGIRSAFGWSSEVLMALDLFVVSGIIFLLARLLLHPGPSLAVWTAVVLYFFYFSTSEWNHALPDGWMLLLALIALHTQQRQFSDWQDGMTSRKRLVGYALVQGLCLGYAFVMKPFVAIPAAAAWLVGAWQIWRIQARFWRLLLLQILILLSGALIVVGGVLVWIWTSGNWAEFVDGALSQWNKEYYDASNGWWDRTTLWRLRFFPWGYSHFLAIPVACGILIRGLTAPRSWLMNPVHRRETALAALYAAWFVQANYIQKQLPYQMAPPLLLGLAILVGSDWVRWVATAGMQVNQRLLGQTGNARRLQTLLRVAVIVILLRAGWQFHPLRRWERLMIWQQCVTGPNTPQLRDDLGTETDVAGADWVDLEKVRKFLEEQGVGDRQLTNYGVSAIHLFTQMDINPATRFPLLWGTLVYFPKHEEQILREVRASPERYIVNDIDQINLRRSDGFLWDPRYRFGIPTNLPRFAGKYPWTEPIVFRSGRYLVHKVRHPRERQDPTEPKATPSR